MDRSDDDRIVGEKTWTAWERGSKEKMRTAGVAQTQLFLAEAKGFIAI